VAVGSGTGWGQAGVARGAARPRQPGPGRPRLTGWGAVSRLAGHRSAFPPETPNALPPGPRAVPRVRVSASLHIDVRGAGAPLVLLHGWAMHRGVFAPLAERL